MQRVPFIHWLANGLFIVTLSALAAWTFFLGFVSAGMSLTPAAALLVFSAPVILVALTLLLLKDQKLLGRIHFVTLGLCLSTLVPLYKQPWSPRHQFVGKVLGIRPGATEAEARRVMDGYLGGDKRDEAGSVPGSLGQKRFTHVISYRWDGDYGDYNSDFGIVYLNGERVIATEFSPD